MGFKAWAVEHIPLRLRTPLQYWYRRLGGRLEKEWPIVARLIPRGHVVVDIGAHTGVYTYLLSKLSRSVEAFEPLPRCAQVIAAFGAANVRVHEVALSSSDGTRDLFIPQVSRVANTGLATFTRPSGPCEAVRVPIRRLDDYGFTDVAFIKIDVEGHELEVLRGAGDTIARSNPLLLIEVEQRHLAIPMRTVFEEVLRMGYQGFFVDGRGLSPLAAFSEAMHQAPFLGDVRAPEYVNNFIFVHGATDQTTWRGGLPPILSPP